MRFADPTRVDPTHVEPTRVAPAGGARTRLALRASSSDVRQLWDLRATNFREAFGETGRRRLVPALS